MRLRRVFLVLILVLLTRMSISAQTDFRCTEVKRAQFFHTLADGPLTRESYGLSEPIPERVSAAVPAAESVAVPLPIPTPLKLESLPAALPSAYHDAFQILKDDNSCSRFFGGSVTAVEVLNRLAGQIKEKPLKDKMVAIEMSGDYALVRNDRTGASYRLFDKATLNSEGPFVKSSSHRTFGSYPSHKDEAKALILLHEIGHLVRGEDGQWLLPNDGRDKDLSERNTQMVESHCVEQLSALRKGGVELAEKK